MMIITDNLAAGLSGNRSHLCCLIATPDEVLPTRVPRGAIFIFIFNRRNLTLPSGQIDRSFSNVALISYTSDCDPAVGTGYHEGSQAVVPVPVYGFAILRFRLLGSAIHCFPPPLGLLVLPPPASVYSDLHGLRRGRSVRCAAPAVADESIRMATRRSREGNREHRCVREPNAA